MLRIRRIAPLCLGLLLAACATNPVTGRREISLVSPERELEIGREGHQAIVHEYGLYDDPALAEYVDGVGQSLAKVSHLPGLKWTFTVLDDPTVNAFATPGGYIYITRGILAHLNSEAQLAGVLGHEIGHVTARHSAQRITQQQLTGLGLTLASVFSEGFRQYSDAAQTALGLMVLKYSRDDENQADELGVGYTVKAGFDPREIPATYHMLDRVGEASGQRLPSFLSTHPNPGDREVRTRQLAAAAAYGKSGLVVGNRAYLGHVDRVVFGRDPRHGFFDGDRYYHPQMAFVIDFPPGWKHQDTRSSVAAGVEGRAAMELRLADAGTLTPGGYARDLIRRGAAAEASGESESLGGLDAWVGRVGTRNANGGTATFVAAFIRMTPDRMIQIAGQSAAARDADEGRIVQSIRSFRPLTDRARLAATPDRVNVVKANTTGSFEQVVLALGRQAADVATTSILNNADRGSEVRAGELLKIVEPGRIR